MSEQREPIPCPYSECGGSFNRSPKTCGRYWRCDNPQCLMQSPHNDEDGTQVRRLVALPDPTKKHEGLDGWVCREMCRRFGGEWKHTELGHWLSPKHTPASAYEGRYSWRPSPPKPRERRREVLPGTLHCLADPVDGDSRWLEHSESPGKRWRVGEQDRLEWAFDCATVWHAPQLQTSMLAGSWTLVTLEPAEGGE